MKAFQPIPHVLIAAACLSLLPGVAVAGPDDAPAPRRSARESATRPAPPRVIVQGDTSTTTTVEDEDRPIQPLRQREESVHYRIAYKLLNNIGFTGTEGDRQPIGYQQIYGPPPMLTYQRPPAPRPRRFPHFAATEDKPEPAAARPRVKSGSIEEPAPDASPAPAALPSAADKPAPDDADPGVLPDAAQQAARGRNEEMLSYFRRPGVGNPPRNLNASPGNGPAPDEAGEPGYLQAPEQLPIPPSRATYRVVPK